MSKQVKESPILFSGPMVQAIIAGRKTQTRRVIRGMGNSSPIHQPEWFNPTRTDRHGEAFLGDPVFGIGGDDWHVVCPYGAPGDRLWVREAFGIVPRTAYARSEGVVQTLRPDHDSHAAVYRAGWDRGGSPGWKPSIHMPRWASRLTLRITDVRAQQVQEIDPNDVVAEGVVCGEHDSADASHSTLFRRVWNSINYKRGHGWDVNPWVWCITFQQVTP